jgi:hypothetical protein
MPNTKSKEGFTKFIFFRWLMHSLTALCIQYAPVCADKVINFHISLFQNVRHMDLNKKPSQINNS